MAATLTYRYRRVRKDGKSKRTFTKGSLIYREPSEKGGFKAVQYSYRKQGLKPNVGGEQKNQ